MSGVTLVMIRPSVASVRLRYFAPENIPPADCPVVDSSLGSLWTE